MSEKLKKLSYKDDELTVEITAVRASAKIGINRYLLSSKAYKENEIETDEALKILRLILFPDLVVTAIEVTGIPWPLSFDEFINLPEDLTNQWADMVYALNPHWRPTIVQDDAGEKKKETPSKKE